VELENYQSEVPHISYVETFWIEIEPCIVKFFPVVCTNSAALPIYDYLMLDTTDNVPCIDLSDPATLAAFDPGYF
jgi:hypothetical protein